MISMNKKSNGPMFPTMQSLPQPGAGLSNSQIERVKDEEIFEQYRDRTACFYKKGKSPPNSAFKLSSEENLTSQYKAVP